MEENVMIEPGTMVRVRHAIDNKPTMIAKERSFERGTFKGIVCFWFTSDGYFQEFVFNTKDLEII